MMAEKIFSKTKAFHHILTPFRRHYNRARPFIIFYDFHTVVISSNQNERTETVGKVLLSYWWYVKFGIDHRDFAVCAIHIYFPHFDARLGLAVLCEFKFDLEFDVAKTQNNRCRCRRAPLKFVHKFNKVPGENQITQYRPYNNDVEFAVKLSDVCACYD